MAQAMRAILLASANPEPSTALGCPLAWGTPFDAYFGGVGALRHGRRLRPNSRYCPDLLGAFNTLVLEATWPSMKIPVGQKQTIETFRQ